MNKERALKTSLHSPLIHGKRFKSTSFEAFSFHNLRNNRSIDFIITMA